MKSSHLRLAARVALAEVAAVAIWAFLVNRFLIHIVDSPTKSAAIVVVALVLGVAGGVSVVGARAAAWSRVWLAVLAVFASGEARRSWLRHAYRVESANDVDLWHPVTTTSLVVRHFDLALAGLAVSRLRVLHISDVHITAGVADSYWDRLLAEMRAQDPDLIVMTGDYLSRFDRLPLLQRWLESMPHARYGAYAVLGNHDHWTEHPELVRAALERAGVHAVGGVCTDVALEVGPPLRVCGTETPWGPTLPADAMAAPSVATAVPNDATVAANLPAATLVLSHTPDNVYPLSDAGATMVFAGHTHGGQVRLPGLGAVIVPSRYGRRFDEGHFVVGQTHLFVSAGVGADAPALRLWCPPELVVVDLRAEHRTVEARATSPGRDAPPPL